MNKRFIFCEECRTEDGMYTISEVPMTSTIRGVEYKYMGKEVRCLNCNSYLYFPDIIDENLEALYKVYRKENGFVSLDVVRAIPEKYSIGKRPLSLLLGWGELTFTRFYDGDMPTRQYSDILIRIYEDPNYFAELLEAGKDKLKSKAAYEKSKKALQKLTNPALNEKSDINIVIQYLLSKCEDITPLALQKALYYVQGFYYAFYNKYLFTDTCEAWSHGPVYREVYYRYRNYRFDPFEIKQTLDDSLLSKEDKEFLDSIVKYVGCYSGKVLENFTHQEAPWVDTRGDLPLSAGCERVISLEAMNNYFSEIKEKYHMESPDDIKKYTMFMFNML